MSPQSLNPTVTAQSLVSTKGEIHFVSSVSPRFITIHESIDCAALQAVTAALDWASLMSLSSSISIITPANNALPCLKYLTGQLDTNSDYYILANCCTEKGMHWLNKIKMFTV